MANTTMRTPGGRLFEYHCERIEVTSSLPRRDPRWTHTDSHGHVHTAAADTFHWVVTDELFDEDVEWDSDWPPEGEYQCLVCGEVVRPGMIGPSSYREFIAGPRHFLVDGVEMSEAEFRVLWEAEQPASPPS